MTFKQSIRFLLSLVDYERWTYRNYNFKLDDYRKYLRKIGKPQQNLAKVVLVAGTKGKGSTATMLAEILKSHGHKVGLYTSPHLLDYRERIRINEKSISGKKFADIVTSLKSSILNHKPLITFFEAMTTIAFLHFAQEATTVNILEVGLGGRLDATNVCSPELSIITRIGYDHTQTLGKTLDKIATEKCGILRKNKQAIIAKQRPTALKTITRLIKNKTAKGYFYKKDYCANLTAETANGITGSYKGFNLNTSFLLSLMGIHQIENAATAIAASQLLCCEKFDEGKMQTALTKLHLPSRIQKLRDKPTIILDMAHNRESAESLLKTLETHFSNKKHRVLLIGFSKYKDKNWILRKLTPFFSEIWITSANLDRADEKESIYNICKNIHNNCRLISSVKAGIERILSKLNNNEMLVITGSVYIAGEALEALKAREGAKVK